MPMSPPEDTSAGSPQSHTAGPARHKVMDYRTLRAVIGGIVILLVPVVYIGNWLIFIRHRGDCFYNPQWIPGSLSGFYYTHMRNLFVGAMCAVGVFFVAYRGHDKWDDRLTNVAGLAAILIALFPTMPPYYSKSPNGPNQFFTSANQCGPTTLITYHLSSHQSSIRYVHVVSLLVLFLMVFLMVLVQFTRTKPSKAEQAATSARESSCMVEGAVPGQAACPQDPCVVEGAVRNQAAAGPEQGLRSLRRRHRAVRVASALHGNLAVGGEDCALAAVRRVPCILVLRARLVCQGRGAEAHTAGWWHSRRTCWRLGACDHWPVLITWCRAYRGRDPRRAGAPRPRGRARHRAQRA